MNISNTWLLGSLAKDDNKLMNDCAKLFSDNYGVWGSLSSHKPGDRVSLSSQWIKRWFEDSGSSIYYARDKDLLVAYAIVLKIKVPKYGNISWITQLVVHEDYRNKQIANNLLESIWGFSDNFAWGIITANPYAIRALEKTTSRRVDPIRVKKNIRKLISVGAEHIWYIKKDIEYSVNNETSQINTEFFVDHEEVPQMIQNVVSSNKIWKLGSLNEGWEWFAFTFKDQTPFELTDQEISNLLRVSDKNVKDAYSRMNYQGNRQGWAKNAIPEAEFIANNLNLTKGSYIADFGCGQGRHAIELSAKGFHVIGIDYIKSNIDVAKQDARDKGFADIVFKYGDCREIHLGYHVDAIICLYDVIGTYVENKENKKILENIFNHLKPGGYALISVMNYELTIYQAKHTFTLKAEKEKLRYIKPGSIMETTGNVFNPDYYLVDTEEEIVYRKEQFSVGKALPAEFIVRDKRFTGKEIKSLCEEVGFEVEFYRYVNSGGWDKEFDPTDKHAKEILVKLKKPLSSGLPPIQMEISSLIEVKNQ